MAARTWDESRAAERIQNRLNELPLADIEIKDYVRDTSLEDLPRNVAYRVDGVHIYVDILNIDDMLQVTAVEGETCHRRTLRFLNLHYRAVSRILNRVDAIQVDFHNQRLHAVVAKPYSDEAGRIHRAIAIAQLISDVLGQTGEDADHPSAVVRVGIDSGVALAVNNGRRGYREPLFLGHPANHAAKRAGGSQKSGIYATNHVRHVIGLAEVDNVDVDRLSDSDISASVAEAGLDVDAATIVGEWQEDLEENPIGAFSFSAHTPPFSNLDIEALSVKNSRRQDAISIYSDIDGFTAYVDRNMMNDDEAKKVVRALHVLRSELDSTLHADFAGRKVRFIGDCIHGLIVEGTAQTTDVEETISNAVLCAAGMRSSFNLTLKKLQASGIDASSLGLQVGFEFGPMTVTRLGMKGDLIRCSVSRGVLASENEQLRCRGNETSIGPIASASGSKPVKDIFGDTRKRANLDYDTAVTELSAKGDRAAKASKSATASSMLKRAAVAPSAFEFPNRPVKPSKPAGFA